MMFKASLNSEEGGSGSYGMRGTFFWRKGSSAASLLYLSCWMSGMSRIYGVFLSQYLWLSFRSSSSVLEYSATLPPRTSRHQLGKSNQSHKSGIPPRLEDDDWVLAVYLLKDIAIHPNKPSCPTSSLIYQYTHPLSTRITIQTPRPKENHSWLSGKQPPPPSNFKCTNKEILSLVL